jgi:hypothetical protein
VALLNVLPTGDGGRSAPKLLYIQLVEEVITMSDGIKNAIMALLEKKSQKGKKRITPNDITKILSDYKKRDVKKSLTALLTEEKINYWSSGSTNYVLLPENYAALKTIEEYHQPFAESGSRGSFTPSPHTT